MKARIVKILFASVFMLGLILSGCLAPKDAKPIATFTHTPAHTNTPFVKYTPQPTRDLPTKTPFSTVDPSTYSRPTSTQAPIMISSAVPSGDDLAKAKLTAPKVAPGDNPLQTARSF